MCKSVLDILKQSSTGMTGQELGVKCTSEGIRAWSRELTSLISDKLVRFDENPAPGRYKATNKAFQQ